MTLRTRLIVHLNGLLVVTVALIAGATAFSTLHNLRDRARQDALDTASLLANAAGMAVRPAPPVAEPPDGWPSPEAKRRAESAHGLAERDNWRSAVKRLVQNPPDAGNFQALFVAEEQAQRTGKEPGLGGAPPPTTQQRMQGEVQPGSENPVEPNRGARRPPSRYTRQ